MLYSHLLGPGKPESSQKSNADAHTKNSSFSLAQLLLTVCTAYCLQALKWASTALQTCTEFSFPRLYDLVTQKMTAAGSRVGWTAQLQAVDEGPPAGSGVPGQGTAGRAVAPSPCAEAWHRAGSSSPVCAGPGPHFLGPAAGRRGPVRPCLGRGRSSPEGEERDEEEGPAAAWLLTCVPAERRATLPNTTHLRGPRVPRSARSQIGRAHV